MKKHFHLFTYTLNITQLKDSIAKFIYNDLTKLAFEANLKMRTSISADLSQSQIKNMGFGSPDLLSTTTPTIEMSHIVRDLFKLIIRQTTNLK